MAALAKSYPTVENGEAYYQKLLDQAKRTDARDSVFVRLLLLSTVAEPAAGVRRIIDVW